MLLFCGTAQSKRQKRSELLVASLLKCCSASKKIALLEAQRQGMPTSVDGIHTFRGLQSLARPVHSDVQTVQLDAASAGTMTAIMYGV